MTYDLRLIIELAFFAKVFFDGAIFEKLTLVLFFSGAGKSDFKLDEIFFEMGVERNKGKAFFVKAAGEGIDFR